MSWNLCQYQLVIGVSHLNISADILLLLLCPFHVIDLNAVQTLLGLRNSCVSEGRAIVEFSAIMNAVFLHMVKCMCIKGSAVEIHPSKHCNLIGRRITPPPHPLLMLSPSSILPPPWSQCAFFSAGKISTHVLKMLFSILFYFLKLR
jgi:hypothetical protein